MATAFALLVACAPAAAQVLPAAGGDISGVVKSGGMPLPGVTVSAANTLTGQKAVTSTGDDGSYVLHLAANGRYVVRAEMAAFAAATHEVVMNAESRTARVDLELVLLSRAQQAAEQQQQRQAAAAPNRGFQSLSVMQSGFGADSEGNGVNGGEQGLPAGLQVPGMSAESATESVSISGNTANSGWTNLSSEELRQRVLEMRDRQGGEMGGPGGFGGGPGGRGGFGGGGGGPFTLGGGRGRYNFDRPHGSVYYRADDSALDASPFSLTGVPQAKPSYQQNNFGGSLGGPLNIPKIYNGGQKTFFFVNYNGSRSENPFDAFSTVPTDGSFPGTTDERAGDFTGLVNRQGQPIVLQNPNVPLCQAPNLPCVTGSVLRPGAIDPAAQALLNSIPMPNLPGTVKNFHFITSATSNSDDLNIRIIRSFGKATPRGQRRGGGGGGRGGGRNNLNVGFHYHATGNNLTNPFPSVGGTTSVRSFDIPVGYVRSFGKLTNNLRFDFNRNRIFTKNLYGLTTNNPAAVITLNGIPPLNPFDFGIPNLSFSDFSSLNDFNPLLRRDQTFTISDSMIWSHGKHTWRWGGDFRRIQINTETASNPRGSFTFTGVNTGFDFADFLLGLPQLSTLQSAQVGNNNYHFRGNSWDLFVQDEWRVRGNLTLNLGLRYEYVSPFSEINNLIANLTYAPGLLPPAGLPPAVPVLPAGSNPQLCVKPFACGSSPYTGSLPATLMRPDRNNFAPRVGIAWKPFAKTVVRAGYGINYNTGAYSNIIQQLAFQPPFSVTQTNTECLPSGSATNCIPASQLVLGFSKPTTITNNYGVDPNYRLGYVQIWNLNIQRELKADLLLNIDYTGTKGTRLDVLEAPNRIANGPLNPDVAPFYFETSQADSVAHAGTVRLRKRLRHGVSIGGSYTYSKSIDNASTIGGGTTVVAQNAADLAAERGLSSFDQRHRFAADYLVELPFGHEKRWLSNKSVLRDFFGDWQWSGDWTIASGLPFTPRVLGSSTDVSGGTNGTLRADLVPGQPIALPNPSIGEWFNTAAFVVPPAGSFGDAGRNSIEGPGSLVFDMAFTKVIPLGDVRVLEFRAQMTNIFNTPQFTGIDTTVNSPTFGQVTSVGSMRRIQMQARFRF